VRGSAWTALTLALALGCRGPAPARVLLLPASPRLEVHVIDVGQGDALLVRCPDGIHELLVDAGELDARYPGSGARFRAYLAARQPGDDPIDVVVATHPHSDHIGNLPWVVERYLIGLYVDSGRRASTAVFRALEARLAEHGVPRRRLTDAALPDIDFCPRPDVGARILRPAGLDVEAEDPNDASVIVRVDCGATSFLLAGDAEARAERLLLDDPATRADLDCDVLKAGHHGSDTSGGPAFLAAVSPAIVAVSCGARDVGTNRGFRHPRLAALRALAAAAGPREGGPGEADAYDGARRAWTRTPLATAVHVTAAEGDLVFESDGAAVRRRTSPSPILIEARQARNPVLQ
jgi:competence protein ComEC